MAPSEIQIANLLYRYAEYIDSGDFDGAAALFRHAEVYTGKATLTEPDLAAMWKQAVILYDCGTRAPSM